MANGYNYRFMRSSIPISFSFPPAGGRQSTWMASVPWAFKLSAKDSSPTLIAANGPCSTDKSTGFIPTTATMLTAGLGYSHGYLPWLQAEPHDVPLDALLTEDGVFWQQGG